jgi:hypothetical protein
MAYIPVLTSTGSAEAMASKSQRNIATAVLYQDPTFYRTADNDKAPETGALSVLV